MKNLALIVVAPLVLLFVAACLPESPRIQQLVAGENHACALDNKISDVICWGDNTYGQATVPALNDPRWIAAGSGFSCAIDASGVRCWGKNDAGQTDASSGLINARAISAGFDHACAIAGSGVHCWGDDTYGQISRMPTINGAKTLAAGGYHTCVNDNDGIKCWGRNAEGQSNVPAFTSPSQLVAGGFHNCVIDAGAVKCWGGSNPGILNDIPSVTHPTALAAGAFHACVVDAGNTKCWGDESFLSVLSPRELTRPKTLAVGGRLPLAEGGEVFACARHLQGVACWGDNSRGQLSYDGQPYHIVYRAESLIDRPAEDVWAVLMDLDKYPLWNPFTLEMNSSLQLGAPMVMRVKMNSLLVLTQTEHIRVIDHVNHKVCWGINTSTPAFSSGERCQWLEAISPMQTRYVTEDLIEGSSAPGVIASFGTGLEAGFQGVAEQLKARVESL